MEKKFIVKFIISILLFGVLTAGISAGFFVYKNNKTSEYETIEVGRRDIVRDVAVTGTVKAVEEVSLAFKQSGSIVSSIPAIGSVVTQDQVLLEQDTAVLNAQIQQKRAELLTEQRRLEELLSGTRSEEVSVTAAKLVAANRDLDEADQKLISVQIQASQDVASDYSAAVAVLQKLAVTAKNSLITFTSIQEQYFLDSTQTSSMLNNLKADVMVALFSTPAKGGASTQFVSQQTSGLYGQMIRASSVDQSQIDTVIESSLDMAKQLLALLDAVPLDNRISTTDEANLAAAKTSLSADVSSLSSAQQAIAVQKAANNSAIIVAQQAVTQARNTRDTIQEEYQLVTAGPTPQQIRTQEAIIAAVADGIAVLETQLDDYVLRAPIDGIVTNTMIERGEVATAQTPVIELISEAQFEIEAFIPEIDIAYVEVGMAATVTLDAYGETEIFDATIVAIDSTSTIISGAPTFKVTLLFNEPDSRIRSGMTAQVVIVTAERSGVVAVPTWILQQDAQGFFVFVYSVNTQGSGEQIQKQKVAPGLRGSDGYIEIIDGLRAGELLIDQP